MELSPTKIEPHQENPIDRVLLAFCDGVAPAFRRINFTPNMITTLCVIASYFAIVALYRGKKVSFVIWAVVAYVFDCLDGHFARKYDMCTVFGDYYDHLTDWAYYGILLYVAFVVRGLRPAYQRHRWLIYGGMVMLLVAMMWHFGCQETLFAAKQQQKQSTSVSPASPTLQWFRCLCRDAENTVHWSKWFGSGTFNAVLIGLIIVTVQ